jgi:outer membrane protein assembly factor BamB
VTGDGAAAVFGGGASYSEGKVYVTTGLGEVAALDAQSGKLIWSVKPSGPLRGSPTLAFGAVFVMTTNNEIHALAAEDGKALWQESASIGETGVFGVAAPAAGQGTVISGFTTGELIAYRYENGRVLWSDALSRTSLATSVGVLTDIDADPIIDRGRVYALGQGGRMAAYELVSGQRIWELNLAGISTPAVAGDWIFTLTDDSKLLCIARATGKVRWSTQLAKFHNEKKKKGQIFWTGPVLAGDHLWIANTRGEVYAAQVGDGSVRQFTRLGNPVSLAPIVAGSTLYILDDGGRISAFR